MMRQPKHGAFFSGQAGMGSLNTRDAGSPQLRCSSGASEHRRDAIDVAESLQRNHTTPKPPKRSPVWTTTLVSSATDNLHD